MGFKRKMSSCSEPDLRCNSIRAKLILSSPERARLSRAQLAASMRHLNTRFDGGNKARRTVRDPKGVLANGSPGRRVDRHPLSAAILLHCCQRDARLPPGDVRVPGVSLAVVPYDQSII